MSNPTSNSRVKFSFNSDEQHSKHQENKLEDDNENKKVSFSSFLPPPPIFKPRFIPMQRNSTSSAIGSSPLLSTTNSTQTIKSELNSRNSSTMTTPHASQFKPTPISSFESTIDQKAKNNSNFLTSSFVSNEEYKNNFLSHSPSISPMTRFTDIPLPDEETMKITNNPNQPIKQTRKRRRSSINNSKEELERKKKELKTQHSIIEKRRRIKMNREFEALKFLVPACRLSILTGITDGNNFDTSNMMHKLTILQSTVEYIKYLHLIIKLMKLQMLIPKDTRENTKSCFQKNNNLKFVDFDLDLQSYRDIENDFNFEDLFMKVWENEGDVPHDWLDPLTKKILKVLVSDNDDIETEKKEQTTNNIPKMKQRSQSIPNIQTPSTVLEERMQENSEYRKSILKLQDSNSFKLPLPAIIDKHPNLGEIPTSSSPSPTSVSHDRLGSFCASTTNLSPLKNYPQMLNQNKSSLFNITTQNSLPQLKTRNPSYISDYPLNSSNTLFSSLPNPGTPLATTVSSFSSISPDDTNIDNSPHLLATNSETAATSNNSEKHSPEIHAASRLLIEIKSNKRHPSIKNILN